MPVPTMPTEKRMKAKRPATGLRAAAACSAVWMSVWLLSCNATAAVSSFAVGSHSITAAYTGDSNFAATKLAGSFTDPNLPAGYAPFSVHVLGQQVYVAYALRTATPPFRSVDALGKMDPSIAMVICDINMPRLNGIETLERMRADGRWAAIPVVMLTTEGQASLIERAKRAGAKGWIIKPFKPGLLVAAVQRLTA